MGKSSVADNISNELKFTPLPKTQEELNVNAFLCTEDLRQEIQDAKAEKAKEKSLFNSGKISFSQLIGIFCKSCDTMLTQAPKSQHSAELTAKINWAKQLVKAIEAGPNSLRKCINTVGSTLDAINKLFTNSTGEFVVTNDAEFYHCSLSITVLETLLNGERVKKGKGKKIDKDIDHRIYTHNIFSKEYIDLYKSIRNFIDNAHYSYLIKKSQLEQKCEEKNIVKDNHGQNGNLTESEVGKTEPLQNAPIQSSSGATSDEILQSAINSSSPNDSETSAAAISSVSASEIIPSTPSDDTPITSPSWFNLDNSDPKAICLSPTTKEKLTQLKNAVSSDIPYVDRTYALELNRVLNDCFPHFAVADQLEALRLSLRSASVDEITSEWQNLQTILADNDLLSDPVNTSLEELREKIEALSVVLNNEGKSNGEIAACSQQIEVLKQHFSKVNDMYKADLRTLTKNMIDYLSQSSCDNQTREDLEQINSDPSQTNKINEQCLSTTIDVFLWTQMKEYQRQQPKGTKVFTNDEVIQQKTSLDQGLAQLKSSNGFIYKILSRIVEFFTSLTTKPPKPSLAKNRVTFFSSGARQPVSDVDDAAMLQQRVVVAPNVGG